MAVTPADLPSEFALVPEADAQFWIDQAEAAVDRARWVCAGADPDQGVIALASHFMKGAGLGSNTSIAAAVISSKRVGDVSVSVKTGAEADGDHGGSAYGRAFDSMLARVLRARRRHMPTRPRP